jgi:hypothetical protein
MRSQTRPTGTGRGVLASSLNVHWIISCAVALIGCVEGSTSASPRPDVVLIVVDTLRADHASL